METSTTGLLTLLLAAGMAILPPRASAQDRNRQPEAHSAVAVGTGGPMGGRSILFDFQITDDTSEEDLQNFAQLLKDKDPPPSSPA